MTATLKKTSRDEELEPAEVPRGDFPGLLKNLRPDLLSGFLVFLIALPLCLGISVASGYPAMAGVFTAIIGGVVSAIISNSELTVKGPAAGLIPIAAGCVLELSGKGYDQETVWRMALAVGVAAAAIQIIFAVCRTGILGEFFPTSAVHGMLAAIGIIIIAKEIPVALGIIGPRAKGDGLALLMRIPEFVQRMNPDIAIIGIASLVLMFGLPLIKNKYVRIIPAPMLVVLVTIPLGLYFGLSHDHEYTLGGHTHMIAQKNYLVDVPNQMTSAIRHPDFSILKEGFIWKWVVMFALIGSVESLLSAKAIDLLDPWKRKTNLNRDMLAIGLGNLVSASIGGLPMISEIVRSRANLDNGAHTRYANLYHGLFLLVSVATIPMWIHQIPMAALAAMLIYTGFRLAHPREFAHMLHIGPEQLVVFVATILVTLKTDLLIGVGSGILVEFVIHLVNGLPLRSLFVPHVDIECNGDDTCIVRCRRSAVFTNWIPFKIRVERTALVQKKNVVVDLSETRLVDHTVMQKLHELARDFTQQGLSFEITGLDDHRPLSSHPLAARKRRR